MSQGFRTFTSNLMSVGRPAPRQDDESPDNDAGGGYVGAWDGIDSGDLFGWVWRPAAPDEAAVVEQWVDGVLVAQTVANLTRTDLSEAGIGAHAWRMPLALDAQKSEPQQVEMRVRGGGALSRGALALALEQPASAPDPEFAGACDGVVDGFLYGWAWRPGAPDTVARIEQWVDGALVAQTLADLSRADLLEAGVGARAWRMPLVLDPRKSEPQQIEVRVIGGDVLPGGGFALAFNSSLFAAPEDSVASVAGSCDGVIGGELVGWAWRPDVPEEHVEVEAWVDGARIARTVANLPRGDLQGAKVGHGRYGWRLPLTLDPAKSEPQLVEVRTTHGGLIENGRFELTYEPPASEVASGDEVAGTLKSSLGVQGCFDGLKGSTLHGWARNNDAPDETVEVELWVDGARVGEAAANGFRPDLRASGIGHGRYGWRLPVVLDPERTEPMQIEIKVKGGGLVDNGAFELRNDLSPDAPANAHLRPFITSVLDGERQPLLNAPDVETAARTFLIYCPAQREAGEFWAREYDDYRAAAAAFAPVLGRSGEVIFISSVEQANAIAADRVQNGESCVLFSFAPPRLAPLSLRCPLIPVFAWAFPNLPTHASDGDPRSDWRYPLRQTGRAIVFSNFAAAAVRAAMGADYPVAVIVPPQSEAMAPLNPASLARREITIDGAVLDSRAYALDPDDPTIPSPVSPDGAQKRVIALDGVVFAATVDVHDGRQNWKDLISAFVVAHAQTPDATLVVKLQEAAPDWWRQFYRWLALLPKFACRVVAIRGDFDADDERALVAATHWCVSAAKAEGLSSWLQVFMSASRPAVAPAHTAIADLVDPSNALIVASEEEPWSWPDKAEDEGWSWTQHPDDVGPTVRHRLSWTSFSAAFAEAYAIVTKDGARYAKLSAAAAASLQAHAGADSVAERLDAFLGLNAGDGQSLPPVPSALMTESMRA